MKSVGFSRIDVLMLNLPFLWIVRSDLKIQDCHDKHESMVKAKGSLIIFFFARNRTGCNCNSDIGRQREEGGGGVTS